MKLDTTKLEELLQDELDEDRDLRLAVADTMYEYTLQATRGVRPDEKLVWYLGGVFKFASDVQEAFMYSASSAEEAIKVETGTVEDAMYEFKAEFKRTEDRVAIHAPALLQFVSQCVSRAENSFDFSEILSIAVVFYNRLVSQSNAFADESQRQMALMRVGQLLHPVLHRMRPIEGNEAEYYDWLRELHGSLILDPTGREAASLSYEHGRNVKYPIENREAHLRGMQDAGEAFVSLVESYTVRE